MTKSHKIVLADDLRLQLEIEKAFFQRRGFEVVTASSGEEALAATFRELPELVILDQVMPDLQGTDVCGRLKSHAQTRHIPVVIVSAHDTDEIRRASEACGAAAFVSKVGGREQLLEIVASILKVPVRRATRLTVLFSVTTEGGDAKERLGKAVDLSVSGMGLEANQACAPESVLEVRFRIPGDKEDVKLKARVRWSREKSEGVFQVGLEFTEVAALVKQRLGEYMDRAFGREAAS